LAIDWRAIRRLAKAQQGNVTLDQLRHAGVTHAMIKIRVARGALWPQFHRVYSIGDAALIPFGREAAALLSIGSGALLSHRSAMAAWEIGPPDPDVIHVTLVNRKARPRPGVRIHRINALHPRDIRTTHNLRLTSPARTIIDCAPVIDVDRAIADAMARRLLTPPDLAQALDRSPTNHAGVPIVKQHIAGGPVLTRSDKERQLRKLLRAANLPMPLSNARLAGFEVDFYWPEHRLVVEIDGFGTHGSRRSFESDRRKDQLLAVTAGVSVLRFTAWQLDREPLRVIATIAHAIATARASQAA
jgi:very-short-patch-repair endonuclease